MARAIQVAAPETATDHYVIGRNESPVQHLHRQLKPRPRVGERLIDPGEITMDGSNLINGERRGSAGTLDVLNPATGEAFATIPAGTGGDVDAAVAAARAARTSLGRAIGVGARRDRRGWDRRFAADPDALSVLAVNDTGHPIRLAAAYHVYGPAQWGPELAQAAADLGTRPLGNMPFPAGASSVEHSPYGVVGVMTPFERARRAQRVEGRARARAGQHGRGQAITPRPAPG